MTLLTRNLLALIAMTTVISAAEKSSGAPKPPAGSTSQLPQKLPPKKKTTKRTYIDMSDSAGVVIAPKNPSLNKALQKSEVQKTEAEVRVQSRIFVPAPPGDLSEIPSIASKPVTATAPAPTPANSVALTPIQPKTVTAAPSTAPAPVILPPVPFEPLQEFSQARIETTTRVETTVEASAEPPVSAEDTPIDLKASTSEVAKSTSIVETSAPIVKSIGPQTLAFVRTGYLQAKYGKFDSRMKDGATYMGLGVAREFETAWGSFEARASMDAYHAMDQSVTVDNIRMLATRTEVGYWFTRTRVRPGISLGLGWTDYSVRSYRSVTSSNSAPSDPSNQTVVLKTHAKSQAFTVIPGTSLRIEVADGLVIDTQTEFLAILGGDSADAVQGLSFGIGLGWIF